MAKEKKSEVDFMGLIDAAVEQQKEKLPNPKEQQALKEVLTDVFCEQKSLKDALDINDDIMECLYSSAYNLYNSGNFEKSLSIFKVLTTLNPGTIKYHMGLAASYQMLKQYDMAITVYMAIAAVDKSPIPFYHAADCYIQLKRPGVAVIMLEFAVSRCGDDPMYAAIKEKATLIQQKLNSDLQEQNKQ